VDEHVSCAAASTTERRRSGIDRSKVDDRGRTGTKFTTTSSQGGQFSLELDGRLAVVVYHPVL